MTASLVSVNAGVATVYSSGDLSSLAGLSALSSIVITKNNSTHSAGGAKRLGG